MIKHRTRLTGLALVATIELAVYLAPALGYLDEGTASGVGQALLALAVALGIVDAALVERARRDPTRPALVDDVVAAPRSHRRTLRGRDTDPPGPPPVTGLL